MITRRRRWMAMLALAPALVGCSIGDVRRLPPAPTSVPSTSTPSSPVPTQIAEIRGSRLAVPQRYDQPYVEFVDASRGYALFSACDGRPPGPDCPALLWSTIDGGRSWQRLRHPKPVADNQQMYALPGVLALWAEPHGWWTSTDGGRTFQHRPGEAAPPQWQAAQGKFQIIEETGKVGRWTGKALRPLATQPPLPALNMVVQGDGWMVRDGIKYYGPLVAAGAGEDGRPYAAISWDEGRRWEKTPVPAPDGAVWLLRTELAAGELWLIGERPDRISFPVLWRLEGGSWQRVRAEGNPEAGRAVPLGAEVVAVISSRGAGALLGGRYVDLPRWPLTDRHHLRRLSDGTLFAGTSETILLGIGHLGDRTWVQVVLEMD
ncbi:hypothetical protein AB0M35_06905 [Micromonospora sp. NPDC051196]|uniref:hypothetical protein n=1 Tax=Micromonospora sp. NPDC051196 TaxID=3155281 RepID=UPI003424E805